MNPIKPVCLATVLVLSCSSIASSHADPWVEYWHEQLDGIADEQLKSYALTQIGVDHLNKGEFDSALSAFHEAKEIRQRIENHELVVSSIVSIASVYIEKGILDVAISVLDEGLRFANNHMLASDIIDVQHILSSLYLEQGQYKKAIASARVSIDGYRDLGQWERESYALFVEGIALNRSGNIKESEDSLKRSYLLYQKRSVTYESDEYRELADSRLRAARELGIDTSRWKIE